MTLAQYRISTPPGQALGHTMGRKRTGSALALSDQEAPRPSKTPKVTKHPPVQRMYVEISTALPTLTSNMRARQSNPITPESIPGQSVSRVFVQDPSITQWGAILTYPASYHLRNREEEPPHPQSPTPQNAGYEPDLSSKPCHSMAVMTLTR